LRRRGQERHIERAMAMFQKYGLLGVLVPSILPPPVPFKVFVLAAGLAKVRRVEFLVAVAIGRGIRYFGEALLALYYGDRAAEYLTTHSRGASILLAVLVLLIGTWWFLRRRWQAES
jgi:membrane protein DedA with SNARE-associated domain